MARHSDDEDISGRRHDRRSRSADGKYTERAGVESSDDGHRRHRRDRSNHRDQPYARRERRERSTEGSSHESSRPQNARRYRERSRSPRRSRHHSSSRSPPAKSRRRSYSRSRSPPPRRSRAPLPSQLESFRGDVATSGPPGEAPPEKQKPNYKPTGILAREANTVAGSNIVLKYHEPPEARKPPPKQQWRMYVFKGKDLVDTVYLHERSAWLMGRDQKVTDLHLEHPSISKQHAVIQFRHITTTNEFGDKKNRVKPYLIDLESANGTRLNDEQIETSRYVELVHQDVIIFGDSEREYVMMLPT